MRRAWPGGELAHQGAGIFDVLDSFTANDRVGDFARQRYRARVESGLARSISGGSPGYLTASTPIHSRSARADEARACRPHPTSTASRREVQRLDDSRDKPVDRGSLSRSLCSARATASSKAAGCCNLIGFITLLESFEEFSASFRFAATGAHQRARTRPVSPSRLRCAPSAINRLKTFGDGRYYLRSARESRKSHRRFRSHQDPKLLSAGLRKTLGKYYRQPFETGVRLTIDVGGGQDSRHVRALSDESRDRRFPRAPPRSSAIQAGEPHAAAARHLRSSSASP